MSPPRRTATAETRDPLERVLDGLDEVRRELADVKQTIERRLVPVESAVGSIADHENRLKKLEERVAEARGAAWAGKVIWAVTLALASAAGWIAATVLRH